MNKIFLLPTLAAVVALGTATSCKTDEEPDWDSINNVVNGGNESNNDSNNEGNGNISDPSDATDFRAIRLNEKDGNKPKFIELYNTSDQTIDIGGMQLRKNDSELVYVAPLATTMAPHAYLVLLSDQTDYALGFTSGLSAKKSLKIELLGPDNSVVDMFYNPSIAKGQVWDEAAPLYNGDTEKMAYGRKPDGTGAWFMIARTDGASNNNAETLTEINQ